MTTARYTKEGSPCGSHSPYAPRAPSYRDKVMQNQEYNMQSSMTEKMTSHGGSQRQHISFNKELCIRLYDLAVGTGFASSSQKTSQAVLNSAVTSLLLEAPIAEGGDSAVKAAVQIHLILLQALDMTVDLQSNMVVFAPLWELIKDQLGKRDVVYGGTPGTSPTRSTSSYDGSCHSKETDACDRGYPSAVTAEMEEKMEHLANVSFSIVNGAWATPQANRSTDRVAASESPVVTVDKLYVEFCAKSFGRYDSYLCALVLSEMRNAGCKIEPPRLFNESWEFVSQRCKHATRVFGRAKDYNAFTKNKEAWYLALFTSESTQGMREALQDLEHDLWYASFDKQSEDRERLFDLLVSLMGHEDSVVRSRAVVMLNCFCDGHDWQLIIPFLPQVKHVNENFIVEMKLDPGSPFPENTYLVLSAPAALTEVALDNIYSYHSIEWSIASDGGYVGTCNLGLLTRCGYYDWRLIQGYEDLGSWENVHSSLNTQRQKTSSRIFSKPNVPNIPKQAVVDHTKTLSILLGDDTTQTIPVQGRIIVHPASLKNGYVHEVFIDAHNADFDEKNKTFSGRGSFRSIANSLPQYKSKGINVLYLMGALARNNGDLRQKEYSDSVFENPNASPFAVTARDQPCQMLGDVGEFLNLTREAEQHGIQVVVDGLQRISSSRPHRKYRDLFLSHVDRNGVCQKVIGAAGRSVDFNDSCILNYRKGAAWRVYADDQIAWLQRYNANGIRLEEAACAPQIYDMDKEELDRRDADGVAHYSFTERLCGLVVKPFQTTRSGFWVSEASDHWPNPFFVYTAKSLWKNRSDAIVLGECHDIKSIAAVSRSGPVPVVQGLMQAVGKALGKCIGPSGDIIGCNPEGSVAIEAYMQACRMLLPENGIIVQSSCTAISPYPALLFGKNTWPFIDLLFLSPGIPATLGGEIDGHAYRIDGTTVFTRTFQKVEDQAHFMDFNRMRVKRMNSRLKLGQQGSKVFGSVHPSQTPPVDDDEPLAVQAPMLQKKGSTRTSTVVPTTETSAPSREGAQTAKTEALQPSGNLQAQGNLQVCTTGVSPMKAIRTDKGVEDISNIRIREEQFRQSFGADSGFDLQKISGHYRHRLQVRQEMLDFWTRPDSVHLSARVTPEKLCLCNVSINKLGFNIMVTNFSEKTVTSQVSLSQLIPIFSGFDIDMSAIFRCSNRLEPSACEDEYYHLRELMSVDVPVKVPPHGSAVLEYRIESGEVPRVRILISALRRLEDMKIRVAQAMQDTTEKLPPSLCNSILNNAFISELVNAILEEKDLVKLCTVLEIYGLALTSRAAKPDQSILAEYLLSLLIELHLFSSAFCSQVLPVTPPKLGTMFLAKLAKLSGRQFEGMPMLATRPAQTLGQEIAESFLLSNGLGPIVFLTTELGKWSTVGGLGVMVDELTVTLVEELGQEVWVFSPYYHYNRKGETGYLTKDGIKWSFNVTIKVGAEDITMGIFEGVVKGVRLLFMHNERIFPNSYPDGSTDDQMRFLTTFSKGCLESICHLRNIPELIVTNDWPAGLCAAYAKKQFGETFQKTTFFHIIHNMNPGYEGRIFVKPGQTLQWVHNLPNDLLVDPLWAQAIVNPCRCALLTTDAWGTVSRTYRDELCGRNGKPPSSPLAPLLNRFPSPFAFPNGINLRQRLHELSAEKLGARNHVEAKGMLQMRYFQFSEPDPSIPLFAFIGRITSQKGVHLILDSIETLLQRYQFRIQIIVGGMVNWRESYAANCGHKMNELRYKYPYCFWADPNAFFTDGALVNLGADFALMPSAFEPGGIVQHEFFVAGTPVVAFKTGGLSDTVQEFTEDNTGNGFTFLSYNVGDFMFAVDRAMRTFADTARYKILRANSFKNVVTLDVVAMAWLQEFCRLRRKLPFNLPEVQRLAKQQPDFDSSRMSQEPQYFEVVLAEQEKEEEKLRQKQKNHEAVKYGKSRTRLCRIRYQPPENRPRPRVVTMAGSFDNWQVRRSLTWEPSQDAFVLSLAVTPGRYTYKLIVDGVWTCNTTGPIERDEEGVENNVLVVEP